jgi:hypothetical protein
MELVDRALAPYLVCHNPSSACVISGHLGVPVFGQPLEVVLSRGLPLFLSRIMMQFETQAPSSPEMFAIASNPIRIQSLKAVRRVVPPPL